MSTIEISFRISYVFFDDKHKKIQKNKINKIINNIDYDDQFIKRNSYTNSDNDVIS